MTMNYALLLGLFVVLTVPGVSFENGWRLTATRHFDIAFTVLTAEDLARVAETAEHAYRRVSRRMEHDLTFRPLLVVFATGAQREHAIATRTYPGNREHLLWALDAPAPRFSHELAHSFVFDMVPAAAHQRIPGWLHEGLAESQTGEWTDEDRAVVRELLRQGALPKLNALPGERSQRIVGRLAVDFLESRRGRGAVRDVLRSSRPADAYFKAVGLAGASFDREFERYVRSVAETRRMTQTRSFKVEPYICVETWFSKGDLWFSKLKAAFSRSLWVGPSRDLLKLRGASSMALLMLLRRSRSCQATSLLSSYRYRMRFWNHDICCCAQIHFISTHSGFIGVTPCFSNCYR